MTEVTRRVSLHANENKRERSNPLKNKRENGAQGRNRTSDTAIFSRMLYQLSYLGLARLAAKRRRL